MIFIVNHILHLVRKELIEGGFGAFGQVEFLNTLKYGGIIALSDECADMRMAPERWSWFGLLLNYWFFGHDRLRLLNFLFVYGIIFLGNIRF